MAKSITVAGVEQRMCWNCRQPMERTGSFYTCPHCGATDCDLSKLQDLFIPHEGQRETANFAKGKRLKLRRR